MSLSLGCREGSGLNKIANWGSGAVKSEETERIANMALLALSFYLPM
jgi:hypothetical protein